MKKVLIIAYYFPPLGWSGVQRTLKFTKYLQSFGWEPVVVTVGKTKFSILDDTLMNEIPKGINILRFDDVRFKDITDEVKEKMREYTKYSFDMISDKDLKNEYEKSIEDAFEKLRERFLIPDGNAVWANNIIKNISNKLDLNSIDIVYTTSSPYSAHLIGYYLKKKYNLPWVCDFRDEWTNNPYLSTERESLRYKVEKNIEETILRYADRIVVTTPLICENYKKNFHVEEEKILTITNGYDEEDFNFKDVLDSKNYFKIIFNGSFHLGVNPFIILQAVKNLIIKKYIDKQKIKFIFIGKNEEQVINIINEKYEHKDLIEWKGYLPHRESLQIASMANILFLSLGKGEKVKSVYTGKIFEYLRMKKPILSISPKDSLVDKLLSETGSGINFEDGDLRGAESYILTQYNNWLCNKEFIVNEDKIKKYERKYLTQKLAEIFDEILDEK